MSDRLHRPNRGLKARRYWTWPFSDFVPSALISKILRTVLANRSSLTGFCRNSVSQSTDLASGITNVLCSQV